MLSSLVEDSGNVIGDDLWARLRRRGLELKDKFYADCLEEELNRVEDAWLRRRVWLSSKPL